jgi:hypothetical protein
LDPFLVQSSEPAALRPALALEADLSSVLREGRVLAGEVLQTLDGGSLLIGVGQHRIPARSQVEMEPGQRFLFLVESGEEPFVLRVLAPEGPGEPELVRVLRGVWGEDLPQGQLLTRLAASAHETAHAPDAAAGESALAARLLGAIEQQLFAPGDDARELRDRVVGSGLGYEGRLARLLAAAPDHQRTLVALAEGIRQALGTTPEAVLRDALWTEIARLAGASGERAALAAMLARGELAEVMRDAHGLLARALHARGGASSPHTRGGANAPVLAAFSAIPPALRPAVLMELLGVATAPRPATDTRSELAGLAADLKGQLLRALAELPEGRLRATVARTLSGIEAEQLLNLARGAGDQPLHWTLALPDGARWADLHFFHRRWRGAGRAESPDGLVHKIVVGVELSSTGPLRADLLVRSDSLSVRLAAARPEVVERLRAALPELEQRLALGGRRVLLSVTRAGEDKVRVDEEVGDVAYLREHRVMDVEG